jgi:hypothetical protein
MGSADRTAEDNASSGEGPYLLHCSLDINRPSKDAIHCCRWRASSERLRSLVPAMLGDQLPDETQIPLSAGRIPGRRSEGVDAVRFGSGTCGRPLVCPCHWRRVSDRWQWDHDCIFRM